MMAAGMSLLSLQVLVQLCVRQANTREVR
jgi:hypothetical protein